MNRLKDLENLYGNLQPQHQPQRPRLQPGCTKHKILQFRSLRGWDKIGICGYAHFLAALALTWLPKMGKQSSHRVARLLATRCIGFSPSGWYGHVRVLIVSCALAWSCWILLWACTLIVSYALARSCKRSPKAPSHPHAIGSLIGSECGMPPSCSEESS